MFAACFAWGVLIVFHNYVALSLFYAAFCFRVGNWLPLHQHKKKVAMRQVAGKEGTKKRIYSANMDGIAVKRTQLANTKRGVQKGEGGGIKNSIITKYLANTDGIAVSKRHFLQKEIIKNRRGAQKLVSLQTSLKTWMGSR